MPKKLKKRFDLKLSVNLFRMGGIFLLCLLMACNGNNNDKPQVKANKQAAVPFDTQFAKASLPYQLSDTGLVKNNDTGTVAATMVTPLIPDSMLQQLFGKAHSIKYTPLAKLEQKDKAVFYIFKATAGDKKAALLLAFDKDNNYGAALPFLIPDDKSETSQTSSVDKSFAIIKSIVQREGDVLGEGKEVVAFDPVTKKFNQVLMDLLNDNPAVLVNPIDTFQKTNKLAGDYYLNKKNLVAVRDGRYPSQLLVYIHTENEEGDCKGELKGEFILTGSESAAYQKGGDPCALTLLFSGNDVTISEHTGCGNYRGLDCPFHGTFTRKKEQKPKKESSKRKSK